MYARHFLKSLGNLAAYLVRIHIGIALGRPAYSKMKDGFVTVITFVGVALLATVPGILSHWNMVDVTDIGVLMYSLGLALAPIAVVALFASRVTPSIFLFPASLYGACTVVDLGAAALYAVGVVQSPINWGFTLSKVFFWSLCYRQYKALPEQVRARGYGLKNGEI
jgi:hypothetical protein